jgi:hypothetical protein
MYWAFEVLITVLLKIQILEVTASHWVCSFQCFIRIIAPPSSVLLSPRFKKCKNSGIEICALLGYYTVYSGIVIQTFQDIYHSHLKGSRIPVTRGFLDPEEFRYHLLHSGSPKSRENRTAFP